ncbi:MAG: InlB B-repeat-containing protein, partial [Propionibacteriaceae bacterium]|nr:InlB B-repeat-containing protein [Propionibacteriaceae bacterium]
RNYDFWAGWVKKKFDLYYDLNTTDTTAAYGPGADWDTDGDNYKLDGTTESRDGYDEDLEFGDLISAARNIGWASDSTLAPTRDHYDFTGWSLEGCTADGYPARESGTYRMPDLDDNDPANDPDQLTVYACWKIHVNDLYYHPNAPAGEVTFPTSACAALVGGSSAPTSDPENLPQDAAYPWNELIVDAPHYDSCVPVRPGYIFKGWTLDADGLIAIGGTTMPDSDYEIWAQWEAEPEIENPFTPTPEPPVNTPEPPNPTPEPSESDSPKNTTGPSPSSSSSQKTTPEPSSTGEPTPEPTEEPTDCCQPVFPTGGDTFNGLAAPALAACLAGLFVLVRRRRS